MPHQGPSGQTPDRRVCLLTGAAGTLGTAFCRRHGDGYAIAAVYGRRAPQPPADGSAFLGIRADLAADGETARVVDVALERFGRVDLLVNAAAHSVWGPIVGSRRVLDSATRQLLVNVVVPLRLAAEVAERFWVSRPDENRAHNRHVLNISSTAGVRVYRGQGQQVYSASKAALTFLSVHLAEEFGAFGVRVNALAPGAFGHEVSLDRVVDAMVGLDSGTTTGRVLVQPRGDEYEVRL